MRRHSGFSLIELMIAVTLGLVAIAAVGSVFIYGSRSYKEDDRVSRMQDELRFAMAQMSQDLEMAGFYAQVRNPVDDIGIDGTATINTGAVNSDCGPTTDGSATHTDSNNWVFRQRSASIYTRGDATAAIANATFPCISTTEFYAGPTGLGTDVIAIKRLSGSPTTPPAGTTKAFLKTNGVQTAIFQGEGTSVEPTTGSIDTYQFLPAVWFLRRWPSGTSGTEIPSLCRYSYDNQTMHNLECLAQGIEDMKLEFGIDVDGNGVVDYFKQYAQTDVPTIAELSTVTAVRVHLLARSIDPDQSYVNTKTYVLGAHSYAAFNDKYHRKVLSSIVLLRNPTNLRTPEELPE